MKLILEYAKGEGRYVRRYAWDMLARSLYEPYRRLTCEQTAHTLLRDARHVLSPREFRPFRVIVNSPRMIRDVSFQSFYLRRPVRVRARDPAHVVIDPTQILIEKSDVSRSPPSLAVRFSDLHSTFSRVYGTIIGSIRQTTDGKSRLMFGGSSRW